MKVSGLKVSSFSADEAGRGFNLVRVEASLRLLLLLHRFYWFLSFLADCYFLADSEDNLYYLLTSVYNPAAS